MTSLIHGDGSSISSSLSQSKGRDEPSAPARLQKGAETGPAHLMSLPRELRDKIYGYLLRVDGFAILRDEKPDKLDLSILRVNQTLHTEASRTLYVENPWVHIAVEPQLLQILRGGKVRGKRGFLGDQPISTGTSARISAGAVATITLQTLSHVDPTINQSPLAVCLFAIPRLCRILQCYPRVNEIDIAVYFYAKTAGRVKEAWQERMMNWLEETRGFGRAGIFGGRGNQSLFELPALMMSPSPSLQEYLDRAYAYRSRALQKEKSGRLSEARYDYQDCYNFCLWSTYFATETLDDAVTSSISHLMNEINVSYAFLLIKLRDLDRALYHIDWTLKYRLKYWEDTSGVETMFICGLRDVAIGADCGAAYCFLRVLREQPGHHGADNAVDEIESRMTYRTGPKGRTILYNIEHVLQPFRHQKPGSAVMDKAAYRALAERWLRCVDEVHVIGYRHRWGFN